MRGDRNMKMGCVIVVLGWVFAAPVSAQDAYVVFQYNSDLEQNDGSGGTLHEVVRGETLYSIVQRHFGPEQDHAYLMSEILRLNPRAFRRGNVDFLLAGSVLTLPLAEIDLEDIDDIYFF